MLIKMMRIHNMDSKKGNMKDAKDALVFFMGFFRKVREGCVHGGERQKYFDMCN